MRRLAAGTNDQGMNQAPISLLAEGSQEQAESRSRDWASSNLPGTRWDKRSVEGLEFWKRKLAESTELRALLMESGGNSAEDMKSEVRMFRRVQRVTKQNTL